MSGESKPLPCPFCNGDTVSSGIDESFDIRHDVIYMVCQRCIAKGPWIHYPRNSQTPEHLQAAIAAWNQRAQA